MINIRVSDKSEKLLYAELNNKVMGIKELNSVETKNQILSAAFSISSLKFIKDTHLLSRSAKKKFHHIYEWGQVGTEQGRLYRLIKRQTGSNSIEVYYRFNNSKLKSPISKDLKVPGPTGKTVNKSGIFKRKAEVMESGKPVSFITQRTIAFSSGGSLVFVPPGKTINIKNPGGAETSGSFNSHFVAWWNINFPASLDRLGIIKRLESNVAASLSRNGSGKNESRRAIQSTLAPHLIVGSVV